MVMMTRLGKLVSTHSAVLCAAAARRVGGRVKTEIIKIFFIFWNKNIAKHSKNIKHSKFVMHFVRPEMSSEKYAKRGVWGGVV